MPGQTELKDEPLGCERCPSLDFFGDKSQLPDVKTSHGLRQTANDAYHQSYSDDINIGDVPHPL